MYVERFLGEMIQLHVYLFTYYMYSVNTIKHSMKYSTK